ncbi:CDP-glucose 4,6-dehydratase [Brevibacillus sp. SYSU BS000544]|uniref:CDP-glucose 4,6-dehydratase n=1 Tax=Brevibacillus sp. SYSU BS000544 TaxID=3416443 RepID=UPI003CE4E652
MNQHFWKNKRVFVTGHTGFKGSWLCLWLSSLGAEVTGYALRPPTEPSLYKLCNIDSMVTSIIGDIRDREKLRDSILASSPEIVFHMAAQPIVRDSYPFAVETYEINVMGTVYLLDAVKHANENGKQIRAVVNVTSDKCYENKEWLWGYRESDELGGYDPYSNSKACSELVTLSYRRSFFESKNQGNRSVGIATARAGNVIGGGDWASDRLVPDCIRSILTNTPITIRNLQAIRPWQHVLEPLYGYLLLAQKLAEDGASFSEPWNFGPNQEDIRSVEWVVQRLYSKWGHGLKFQHQAEKGLHEATNLQLDCSKAKRKLGWSPQWDLETTMDKILEWTRGYAEGADVKAICMSQIQEYSNGRTTT